MLLAHLTKNIFIIHTVIGVSLLTHLLEIAVGDLLLRCVLYIIFLLLLLLGKIIETYYLLPIIFYKAIYVILMLRVRALARRRHSLLVLLLVVLTYSGVAADGREVPWVSWRY